MNQLLDFIVAGVALPDTLEQSREEITRLTKENARLRHEVDLLTSTIEQLDGDMRHLELKLESTNDRSNPPD